MKIKALLALLRILSFVFITVSCKPEGEENKTDADNGTSEGDGKNDTETEDGGNTDNEGGADDGENNTENGENGGRKNHRRPPYRRHRKPKTGGEG